MLHGSCKKKKHECPVGNRYAADLRRRGLEAEVIVTKGTLDNVRRLVEGGNAVAFTPSNVDWSSGAGARHLVALGSVGIEPLWLFYRSDLEIVRISDLSGRKVVTEGGGASSDYAGRMLIEKNGLAGEVDLQPLAGQTAKAIVQGFAAKTIDAGFVAGDVNSPVVESMLNADDATFLSFDRAEAYARLVQGITALRAPEGVFDLVSNVAHRARICVNCHVGPKQQQVVLPTLKTVYSHRNPQG